MYINEDKLENYIKQHNILSDADLENARSNAQNHEIDLYAAILHTGVLPESRLQQVVAEIKDIPFVSLAEQKINTSTLARISEQVAKRHSVIAYHEEDDTLDIAMIDPGNIGVIEIIEKATGMHVIPHMTDMASIHNALLQYRKSLNVEFDELIQQQVSSVGILDDGAERTPAELKKMAEDVPIIKIVDTLISHAILQNASDVHIEPEENALMVRYRVDGILHDVMELPKNITAGVIVRVKVLASLRLDEKRLPQDGRFKTEFNDQDVSFRVSTLPTYFGEKVVIRILRESAHMMSLETLGFHGDALEHIHSALRQKTGLILVSGPTGSGKTTTLYTMLDILNTTDVNISTVEDPVEYQVDRINQTQVREDIGLTFATGLRSLLRQDPDILMVGEIRDQETVSLAVNAALTGHLVLSTIHTNSAAGVIPRMVDMGVETFLIASTIKTITAQRLVRVLVDSKESYTLSDEEVAELGEVVNLEHVLDRLKKEKIVGENDTWQTIPFYKAVPTKEYESGYSGRIGIQEVLHITDDIKKIINQGGDEADIEQAAKEAGMLTMIEEGIFKAAQGITTTEEVLRVVSD